MVSTNWKDSSYKLTNALWAYRTAYKTNLCMSPYKLVYVKACHLPAELEHRAYWTTRALNFHIEESGTLRKLQLNALEELRNDAYDRARTYKSKLKFWHDQPILRKKLELGDKVLLYDSKLYLFQGKLRSCWIGPFIVKIVFPHRAIENVDPKDGNGFKVNGQRLKPFLEGYAPEYKDI